MRRVNVEAGWFLPITMNERQKLLKFGKNKTCSLENCGMDLYERDQDISIWHVDSGYWRHMTSDINKFVSSNEVKKGKNVSFGNKSPSTIKGKGSIVLKYKIKSQNIHL